MSLVAEVRARLAAATPGPWRVKFSGRGYPYQITAPNGSHAKYVTRWAAISVPSLPEGRANAALIAAAPTDLARLCDRVEELERALKLIASHAGKTLLGKGLYHDGANAAFNNMAEIADAALGETPP